MTEAHGKPGTNGVLPHERVEPIEGPAMREGQVVPADDAVGAVAAGVREELNPAISEAVAEFFARAVDLSDYQDKVPQLKAAVQKKLILRGGPAVSLRQILIIAAGEVFGRETPVFLIDVFFRSTFRKIWELYGSKLNPNQARAVEAHLFRNLPDISDSIEEEVVLKAIHDSFKASGALLRINDDDLRQAIQADDLFARKVAVASEGASMPAPSVAPVPVIAEDGLAEGARLAEIQELLALIQKDSVLLRSLDEKDSRITPLNSAIGKRIRRYLELMALYFSNGMSPVNVNGVLEVDFPFQVQRENKIGLNYGDLNLDGQNYIVGVDSACRLRLMSECKTAMLFLKSSFKKLAELFSEDIISLPGKRDFESLMIGWMYTNPAAQLFSHLKALSPWVDWLRLGPFCASLDQIRAEIARLLETHAAPGYFIDPIQRAKTMIDQLVPYLDGVEKISPYKNFRCFIFESAVLFQTLLRPWLRLLFGHGYHLLLRPWI